MKKNKSAKKLEVAEVEWGACDTCGALTAWPGNNVSCDNYVDNVLCEGTYRPSDENGCPLDG